MLYKWYLIIGHRYKEVLDELENCEADVLDIHLVWCHDPDYACGLTYNCCHF